MKRLIAIALLVASPAAHSQQIGEPKPPAKQAVRMAWSNLVSIQLREKGCWNEPANPKEGTPRVAFRVQFGEDGHFSQPPELVTPAESLVANPSLQALADKARTALENCNAKGFDLPPRSEGVERKLSAVLNFPEYMDYRSN